MNQKGKARVSQQCSRESYDRGAPVDARLGTGSPAGENRSQRHLCPEAIWFRLQCLGRARTLSVREFRMQLSSGSQDIAQSKGLEREPKNHGVCRRGSLLR